MSKDDFRRELNQTFDQMSGSPSPSLRDRVRSSLGEAQPARGPYWIAGVAAAVIAALIVGLLWANSPFRQSPSTAGTVSSPSPSASPSESPSPSPSATPDSQLPAFVCASSPAGAHASTAPVAFVSDLRTGAHSGYDRLTITFSNGGPGGPVELKTQGNTNFTLSPSGMPVTLKGARGIEVVIHGADLHSSYGGSTDIVTTYSTLLEVRRLEDFEGVVQLGLGLNGTGCYRAFWLTNPDRLVIDVQAAA